MANHSVTVDFFGTGVRCDTGTGTVSLTDLFAAGNMWRVQNQLPIAQLAAFVRSERTLDYIAAASKVWGVPKAEMLRVVRGANKNQSRTMAHIAVAVYAAEYLSPEFHAQLHKELIEGKLLYWRNQGATEFSALNAAIDQHLPGREDKDSNTGIYIQMAKLIRNKITRVEDPEVNVWDKSPALYQQQRAAMENFLVDVLTNGLVRDYDHLKQLATDYRLRLP